MSLAAEAVIIRREEHRHPGGSETRMGLRLHRINEVRSEQRCALLAYGFLRGRTLKAIEPSSYTSPNWKRIEHLIAKYGMGDSRELMQQFSAWKEATT